jgi:4-phospho-D-threonate 3-dehydrogenase / 4-phospho-D-erythronate 3-dehydrogenase
MMPKERRQSSHPKPLIGITMGEPSGIGPEIILKALVQKRIRTLCQPWVIGDVTILQRAARTVKSTLKIKGYARLQSLPESADSIQVLQVSAPPQRLVLRILEQAASLAIQGKLQALVTAPIHKSSLQEAGRHYPGHTEFFAAQAGIKEVGMLMVAGPLKVMLVTTHIGIRDLPSAITQDRVRASIRLTHRALRNYFGIKIPKIAVASLNPHAGEGGLFGNEEARVIQPAVEQIQAEGILASPPLGADTAFRKTVRGEYDAVVAMYHDQALIPIKLLAFGKAVNLTVGLPFIRTSVDHGTADDLAGTGLADPGSLVAAITLAVRLTRQGKKD